MILASLGPLGKPLGGLLSRLGGLLDRLGGLLGRLRAYALTRSLRELTRSLRELTRSIRADDTMIYTEFPVNEALTLFRHRLQGIGMEFNVKWDPGPAQRPPFHVVQVKLHGIPCKWRPDPVQALDFPCRRQLFLLLSEPITTEYSLCRQTGRQRPCKTTRVGARMGEATTQWITSAPH